MELTKKEAEILDALYCMGCGTWVKTLKEQFPNDGDSIQSLGDKKLLAWDSIVVEMTELGKKVVAGEKV